MLDAKSVDVGRHSTDGLSEITTPAEIGVPAATRSADVIPAPTGVTLGPYIAFDEVLPPLNETTLELKHDFTRARRDENETPKFHVADNHRNPAGIE